MLPLLALCSHCFITISWRLSLHGEGKKERPGDKKTLVSFRIHVSSSIGIPRFILLHKCCVFCKLRTRPSTNKKILTCFIATFSLTWWPETEPTVSLRYACTSFIAVVWNWNRIIFEVYLYLPWCVELPT